MTKRSIRENVLNLRSSLSGDDRELKQRLVFQRAHKDKKFQVSSLIHVYCSTKDEVNTSMFIEYAWGTGKTVAVPRMISRDSFESVVVTRDTSWRLDERGINSPVDGDIVPPETLNEHATAIVPVVAFDERCNRIGYGGGVYDRFLQDHRCNTIGIAFELQRVKSIEAEPHDIKLDRIATEERWYSV